MGISGKQSPAAADGPIGPLHDQESGESVFFPGQWGKNTGEIQVILKKRNIPPFHVVLPTPKCACGFPGNSGHQGKLPLPLSSSETAFISGWTLTRLRGSFSRQTVPHVGWPFLCHHLPYHSPLQAGVLGSEPLIGKAWSRLIGVGKAAGGSGWCLGVQCGTCWVCSASQTGKWGWPREEESLSPCQGMRLSIHSLLC